MEFIQSLLVKYEPGRSPNIQENVNFLGIMNKLMKFPREISKALNYTKTQVQINFKPIHSLCFHKEIYIKIDVK